jgi:hypothetical protein
MHQIYHIALFNYGSLYAYVRIRAVEPEQEIHVEQTRAEEVTNISS